MTTPTTTTQELLDVDAARALVLQSVAVVGSESAMLVGAHARVLAEELASKRDVPAFDNSAMDGVGVRAADITQASSSSPVPLLVVASVLPGAAAIPSASPPQALLAAGQCVRIMTGAPIPAGVDAVVMRELTDERDLATSNVISVKEAAPAGQHVRKRGEDVSVGGVVGRVGDVVTPARLNLLLSTGHVSARVFRRPVVGVIASGDELREVGEAAAGDVVINSNAHAIVAAAQANGCDAHFIGIARDSLDSHVALFEQAARFCDAVVSIGGVSMGTHDFVRPALAQIGVTLQMWKVAMRPGKPIAVGSREQSAGARTASTTVFFGLPGNPVSSLVSFALFVQPALKKMRGERAFETPLWPAVLVDSDMKKKPGLEHWARGVVRLVDGKLHVRLHPGQGSHHISALAEANALVKFAKDGDGARAGDVVNVMLLADPLLPSAML